MISDEKIQAAILLKLYKRGNWGHSHTSFDNIKKGFNERDLGKGGLKRVNKMTKELIRKRLIISKPTNYGLEISLNSGMNREICDIIEENFPDSI
jgi:hypothetical protein